MTLKHISATRFGSQEQCVDGRSVSVDDCAELRDSSSAADTADAVDGCGRCSAGRIGKMRDVRCAMR